MQPDHDQTPEQDTQPVADRAVRRKADTPYGPTTGGDDQPGPDYDPAATARRVTTQEAAEGLGITVEAVRARLRRGTLSKEKDSDGTVYVLLTDDQTQRSNDRATEQHQPDDTRPSGAQREGEPTDDRSRSEHVLVEALREQIEILRSEIEDRKEEARRKDAIIMSLSQRFPELPASPGTAARRAPEEGSPMGESQEAPLRRSWFTRFFFGP